MKRRAILATIIAALLNLGCPAALQFLTAATQATSWLGAVIDVAESGANRYHDRHPNFESEALVEFALGEARAAASVFEAAAVAAKDLGDGNLEQARVGAVDAYTRLWDLLDRLRILSGQSPDGGPETSAEMPGPLDLPSPAEALAKTSYK